MAHVSIEQYSDTSIGLSDTTLRTMVCVVDRETLVCAQLLEEMLDNGYPLATESNVLKELIKPPSIVRSVVHTITGESKLAK